MRLSAKDNSYNSLQSKILLTKSILNILFYDNFNIYKFYGKILAVILFN